MVSSWKDRLYEIFDNLIIIRCSIFLLGESERKDMVIYCHGRRSKHAAGIIIGTHPKAQLVLCASFEEVIERVAEIEGDPNKLGIVAVLTPRPDGLHTLATINGLHVVSPSNIPLQVVIGEAKRRVDPVMLYESGVLM